MSVYQYRICMNVSFHRTIMILNVKIYLMTSFSSNTTRELWIDKKEAKEKMI